MVHRIRQGLLGALIIVTLVVSLLGLGGIWTQPAWAAVTQIEEAPGQLLCRSQQSLPDAAGYTWQVILFKQTQCDLLQTEEPSPIYLRLAGLPGAAEVAHPAPLMLTTASGQVFSAPDVFLEEAPAPTIGQYDLQAFAAELPTNSLQLTIPVIDQESVKLSVPQLVVQEWQSVIRPQAS